MGRSSSFILNKSGKTIFWNSVWSNQFNYSNFLNKTFYIEAFLTLMSSNKKFKNSLFILKKIKRKNAKVYSYYYNILTKRKPKILIKKNNLVESAENKVTRLKKEKFKFTNFSKFWIVKYQTWLVITFFVLVNKTLKNKWLKTKKKTFILQRNKKVTKKNFI